MLTLAVGDGGFKPSIDTTLRKKVGFCCLEKALNSAHFPIAVSQSYSMCLFSVIVLIITAIHSNIVVFNLQISGCLWVAELCQSARVIKSLAGVIVTYKCFLVASFFVSLQFSLHLVFLCFVRLRDRAVPSRFMPEYRSKIGFWMNLVQQVKVI